MKRIVTCLATILLLLFMPAANAENSIVRIVAPTSQTFNGEFRNDDLAQSLTPSGNLGMLVFQPIDKHRIWVIDPALIDEIVLMSADYKLITGATPAGKEIASKWLTQFKRVSAANEIVALAYGNPDVSLAKRLAPSELRFYFTYGKNRLQLTLGRIVRSEPKVNWSTGKSLLSNSLRKNYRDNRLALTRLSTVVSAPELIELRARLAQLLSPVLSKRSSEYFSYSATASVNEMVHKLRINSGKYRITTSSVKLPVTVINEFDVDVNVNVLMLPINSRVTVASFDDVIIPAKSKKQLEMLVDVIAPGQTVVSAQITDTLGNEVVPEAKLTLNSTVIDPRVAWITSGSAILLLLAVVAQSIRRVRRRSS